MRGRLRIKDRDDLPGQEMTVGEEFISKRKFLFLFAHGSRMEKFLKAIANKSVTTLGLVALGAILIGTGGLYFGHQKSQRILESKYAMNICFSRLTQSLLAMMHIDLNSKSLSRDFFEGSNECFVQFKNDLKTWGIKEESAPYQSIKELIVDVLDFHRQLGLVTSRPKDTLQWAAIQSEITPQYTKVDRGRFSFNQLIAKELTGSLNVENGSALNYIFYFCILMSSCLLVFGLIFLSWRQSLRLRQMEKWEATAEDLMVTSLENSLRIENFLTDIWKSNQLTKTLKLFKSYHEKLLERTFALSNLRSAHVRKDLDVAFDVSASQPGKLSLSAQLPLEEVANGWSEPREQEEFNHHNHHNHHNLQNLQNHQWEEMLSPLEASATFDTMNDIDYYSQKMEQTLSQWDIEAAKENAAEPSLVADGAEVHDSRIAEEVATIPVQGTNFWESLRKVELRLNAELDDKIFVSVKKYESGIHILAAAEMLEQLTYSIFQKFHKMFAHFGTPFSQRDVGLALKFDPIENRANLTFLAHSTLFSLDDLEYFSQLEGEQDDHQLPIQVDKTSSMIRELLRSVDGTIKIQNILSDDSNPHKCQITLVLPALQVQVQDQDDTNPSLRVKNSGTLTQVIKGKKKDILQNIVKEISV